MSENNYFISKNFINQIFKDLHSHMGWSAFYKKYVIVEPIWYIKKEGNSLIDCVCIDDLLFNFEEPFGKIEAKIIDEEASEFIEQAMIIEDEYLLICDNPILFPYDRLKKFIDYLKKHPANAKEIDGIIHYHIDEPKLSENDIRALTIFTNEMANFNKNEQLGIVISENNPINNFNFLESKRINFVNYLREKFAKDEFTFVGTKFSEYAQKNIQFYYD